MFKNISTFFMATIIVLGCADLSQIRSETRQKLTGLSAGLSKEETLKVMNADTVKAEGHVITHPYRTELHRANGHVFEILLYYTDIQKRDGAITDDELTPLVIMDGQIDGWGWSYWSNMINKYEIRVR